MLVPEMARAGPAIKLTTTWQVIVVGNREGGAKLGFFSELVLLMRGREGGREGGKEGGVDHEEGRFSSRSIQQRSPSLYETTLLLIETSLFRLTGKQEGKQPIR